MGVINMQSLRQYKKFRTALEAQVSRDQDKSNGFSNSKSEPMAPTPNLNPSTDEDQQRDLEKGEDNGGSNSPYSQDTAVADHASTPGATDSDVHATEEVEEPPKEEEDGHDSAEEYYPYPVPESLEHRPTNLSRIQTQKSSRSDLDNMGSRKTSRTDLNRMGTRLGNVMTGINVRKRNNEEGGDGSVFIVGFEGDNDPQNPHNWSLARRAFITIMVAAIGFVVGVASSIDSSATSEAAMEFHVSEVVEVMATGAWSATILNETLLILTQVSTSSASVLALSLQAHSQKRSEGVQYTLPPW